MVDISMLSVNSPASEQGRSARLDGFQGLVKKGANSIQMLRYRVHEPMRRDTAGGWRSNQDSFAVGGWMKWGGLGLAIFCQATGVSPLIPLFSVMGGLFVQSLAYTDTLQHRDFCRFLGNPDNRGKENPYLRNASLGRVLRNIPRVVPA